MNCKHENKKRLYARNQSSGAKQWERKELFCCDDCEAVLEIKLFEKKVVKIDNKNLRNKTKDALCVEGEVEG